LKVSLNLKSREFPEELGIVTKWKKPVAGSYSRWPYADPCIPLALQEEIIGFYSAAKEVKSLQAKRILKRGVDPTSFLHADSGECSIVVGDLPCDLEADFFIVDENVNRLHESVVGRIQCRDKYVLRSDESLKSILGLHKLESSLRTSKAQIRVMTMGGGVLTDFVGFLCALKGWEHSVVPTTLLAMIDASIGGKVGINLLPYGKNLLGAFYFPTRVYVDPRFLDTLDALQLRCGLCEALKHLIIKAETESGLSVEQLQPPLTSQVLSSLIKIKNDIVSGDPFEKGARRLLNLGHSFAHAIEARYKIPHGIAVGLGLQIEGKILGYKVPKPEFLPSLSTFFNQHSINDLSSWLDDLWPILVNDKKGVNTAKVAMSSFNESYRLEMNKKELHNALLAKTYL
jgi:3-dehydroquinate synthetase